MRPVVVLVVYSVIVCSVMIVEPTTEAVSLSMFVGHPLKPRTDAAEIVAVKPDNTSNITELHFFKQQQHFCLNPFVGTSSKHFNFIQTFPWICCHINTSCST